MKGGASKVIMGATLAMVVSLAIVLCLILVLLAELYCSLLLRRRQQRLAATETATAASSTRDANANASSSPPPPFASFYSQGVIQAPRSLLFPFPSDKETSMEEAAGDKEKLKKLHHILDIQAQELDLGSTTTMPVQIRETPSRISPSIVRQEHFVYISNPIYDNEACRPSQVDTPFETPDSSPSRLEMGNSSSNSSSSGDEEEVTKKLKPSKSPPLAPMKKLPAEACSVSLRDARSLVTSGSDSASKNGISSSSSGSPCTSPSW